MAWTTEQEEVILHALIDAPKWQSELLSDLRSKKIDESDKKMFPEKGKNKVSDRSLLAKSRSISEEALTHRILAMMPDKKPADPKPTAAEKRASIFANAPKMKPVQAGTEKVHKAIQAANAAMKKREETREKIRKAAQERREAAEKSAEEAAAQQTS